jgi:lipopolysaccharide/colanic/teichoic acid biosynthesis glycosyltransferase
MRSAALKRTTDIVIAATALLVLSPILLVIALAVKVVMGSPVFFVQERPGLGARPFRVYKFRTMRDSVNEQGQPLDDVARLGRFGTRLRAASLDELPELWNVLVGDMSLVGPRPLLMEYLPLYTPDQARRHEVRPGLTGWAQINGRNAISWEQKFVYDVWYVDHWTNGLDARILLVTVCRVLRAHGISQEGHVTVERFRGSMK